MWATSTPSTTGGRASTPSRSGTRATNNAVSRTRGVIPRCSSCSASCYLVTWTRPRSPGVGRGVEPPGYSGDAADRVPRQYQGDDGVLGYQMLRHRFEAARLGRRVRLFRAAGWSGSPVAQGFCRSARDSRSDPGPRTLHPTSLRSASRGRCPMTPRRGRRTTMSSSSS